MTIAEFLIALANDENLRARFDSEPREVLAEFGIEGERASILLAGKLRDIRVKIQVEIEVDAEIMVFETIWWLKTDPGTRP